MSTFIILLLIVIISLFDTASQMCLKSSVNSLKANVDGIKKVFHFVFRLVHIPRVWLGFTFSALSFFLWLFVLSKVELNFAFSADSMHYIFIAFASGIILKEKVGTLRWMGTLLIVAGIAIVTLS